MGVFAIELVEREMELARLKELLEHAGQARGHVVTLEGPAGIGKTVLLEQAASLANERDLLVLRARGGELERDFPYGIVRQLFEAELRRRPAANRDELLRGAAALASPIVAPASTADVPPLEDPFGVAHGLYWLTANLAEQRPLMLAVDDAHWSDIASLRFLLHLARRLDGLACVAAVCIRSGDPDARDPLIAQLRSEATTLLEPRPLSEEAVTALLAAELGERPAPEFAAACHRATGGTPFLVRELAIDVAERGIAPSAAAAAEVGAAVPRTVALAILLRLGRLPPAAAALARAVAVLGGGAQLQRARQLAGLAEGDAVEAAESLAAATIFRRGLPLEFAHPIVRQAIYGEMSPPARTHAHARAAELLSAEEGDVDAIAAHLLLTEPAGRAETVARLRAAAAGAARRGAPQSALAYLRRALAEGDLGAELRVECLLELGRAARFVEPQTGIQHLREAHRTAELPIQRARVAYDLADLLAWRPEEQTAVPLLNDAAVEEAGEVDSELAVRLEALRTHQAFFMDPAGPPAALARLPELRALARAETRSGRLMALLLACLGGWLGWSREEVRQLLETGMPGGRLPPDEDPDSWIYVPIFHAYVLLEEIDEGLRVAGELFEQARRRGSATGIAVALGGRGWLHSRRGDLPGAEADLRAELKLTAERISPPLVGDIASRYFAVDALIERPSLDDEAEATTNLDLRPEAERISMKALLLETRGRVRLARGRTRDGIEDLRECGRTPWAQGNPTGWLWRPTLAVALVATEPDEALELARAAVQYAGYFDCARATGVALRALGLVEGGKVGLAHLEEAVDVLETGPTPLEHARALVELGAGRRRAGQRAAARDPLRRGMDLAHRCGAVRLEERARGELMAAGARPRRAVLTGRDALTATERRVAELAAGGMSNPEIAQSLFVTRKTVENHLGRIYPKLGINSREQLPEALAAESG